MLLKGVPEENVFGAFAVFVDGIQLSLNGWFGLVWWLGSGFPSKIQTTNSNLQLRLR